MHFKINPKIWLNYNSSKFNNGFEGCNRKLSQQSKHKQTSHQEDSPWKYLVELQAPRDATILELGPTHAIYVLVSFQMSGDWKKHYMVG